MQSVSFFVSIPRSQQSCMHVRMHMHVGTHMLTHASNVILSDVCAQLYKFSFFHPSPHASRVASLRPSRALEAPVQGKEEEDVDI